MSNNTAEKENNCHSELVSESHKPGYKKTKLGWIPQEWDVMQLKDVFKRISRKNNIDNKNILTISAHYGLINQEEFYNKRIASADTSNYILLKRGEFAYNKSYSKNYPMGAIKPLERYNEGVVSSLYICFVQKDNKYSNEYFKHYFEVGKLNKEIYKVAQEGARNHGLLNINTNDFFNSYIYVPNKTSEQKKIAEILTSWDKAIEKTEKLIEIKQKRKESLMQCLLSGRLRFSEFANQERKEYKLGDLFSNRKELNFNDLELLSVTANLGVVPRAQLEAKDNSNDDKSKYLRVLPGDIAYNTMRMWQGRCGLSKYEGIVSPAYTICKPKENVDAEFMYYLFKFPHMIHRFWSYSQGIVDDTLNLKYHNFAIIKVEIPPTKEEQQKIASVLNSCDREIEILKQKLNKLNEQKKGLMQKLLTGQVRVKVS